MNILITAPSLNESENVSGISTIVKTIIRNSNADNKFFHFRIGNKDGNGRGLRWLITQVTIVPRIARFIRTNKIDAIHLNTDFTKASLLRDFIIFSFVKTRFRKDVLLHIHGGYMLMSPPNKGSIFRFIISRMLKDANVNIVLSEIEVQQLNNNFGATGQILANAVEPLKMSSALKDYNCKIKFIFLGRIVKEKGIYLIAEALRQLKDYHNDFSFSIYGTGPELTKFLERLKAIDTLNFEYKGVAKGQGKWEAFEEANVFLLPSIYGEGLPIAMLEAMQSGCIPVVSDDASITTVVKHKVNGFIVKKGNQEELFAILKRILVERESLDILSAAAKKTVLEKYSIEKYMTLLRNYYSTFKSIKIDNS